LKIVLFVIDDLHFVPIISDPIIEKYGSDVVHVYISKTIFSFKKMKSNLSFFIKNRYPFPIKFGDLFKFAMWKFKLITQGSNGHKSLAEYFESKGIPVTHIDTLNGKAYREELKTLDADVFLFSPFDKIAGPKFLAIPKLGAFNIHLGKIPEYKGGLSSFWVLSKNDPIAGASMHSISNVIDEGDLIDEVRFKIETNSMFGLLEDTLRHASQMVLKGLENVQNGTVEKISIEGRVPDYLIYPTKEAFKEFYKNGNILL